ncbi:MAG: FtsQ-type POTRA domain-containing protein [Deltaproteobacteria bacterium]|nr:FtsQ-type POTRA domain-containing protein [Deltaproteobacteria bacterium]
MFNREDKKRKNDSWKLSQVRSNNSPRSEGKSFARLLSLAMLITSATLGSLLIMLTMKIIYSPSFAITEVVVRGNSRVAASQVIAAADIQIGASIFSVNRGAVANRISRNPWVRKAFVGREFPSRVVVQIREKIPQAILQNSDGFSLIDENGEIFKPQFVALNLKLPVLSGDYKTPTEDPALYAQTQELLTFLNQNSKVVGWEQISEINIHTTYGFSLFTDNGTIINLGFGDYEEKFCRLEKTLEKLGTADNRVFDLNFTGRVFIRERENNTVEPTKVAKRRGD